MDSKINVKLVNIIKAAAYTVLQLSVDSQVVKLETF